MARPRSPSLTEGELRIMDVVWEQEETTVRDVTDALSEEGLAYTTVQTMMRILEDKGFLDHRKAGRAFIYRPLVDRQTARRTALRHLLSRFFDGSPSALVQNLLKDEALDAAELARLRAEVRDHDQRGGEDSEEEER